MKKILTLPDYDNLLEQNNFIDEVKEYPIQKSKILTDWKQELPAIISDQIENKPDQIKLIYICGPSGTGKTYLRKYLAGNFDQKESETVKLDNYYPGIADIVVNKFSRLHRINNSEFIQNAIKQVREIIRKKEFNQKFSEPNLNKIIKVFGNLGLILDPELTKKQLLAIKNNIDFDKPQTLDLDLARKHSQLLAKGEKCRIPIYCMNESERQEKTQNINPKHKKIIFYEGLYAFQIIDQNIDSVKIYIKSSIVHKFFRRQIRDTHGPNPRKMYSKEHGAKTILTQVLPNARRYIHEQEKLADYIVQNDLSAEEINKYCRVTNVDRGNLGYHYFYDPKQKNTTERLTLTTQNNLPYQIIYEKKN